jgi:hypothetical protein
MDILEQLMSEFITKQKERSKIQEAAKTQQTRQEFEEKVEEAETSLRNLMPFLYNELVSKYQGVYIPWSQTSVAFRFMYKNHRIIITPKPKPCVESPFYICTPLGIDRPNIDSDSFGFSEKLLASLAELNDALNPIKVNVAIYATIDSVSKQTATEILANILSEKLEGLDFEIDCGF